MTKVTMVKHIDGLLNGMPFPLLGVQELQDHEASVLIADGYAVPYVEPKAPAKDEKVKK